MRSCGGGSPRGGICLAGPAGRAGARCELEDGWGLPWRGSPCTATWEHPSTPLGKRSRISFSATSLSSFSGRYLAKAELPERDTAALAEDDRDAPCALLRALSAPDTRQLRALAAYPQPGFSSPQPPVHSSQGIRFTSHPRSPGGQGGLYTPSRIRASPSPHPGWLRAEGTGRPSFPPSLPGARALRCRGEGRSAWHGAPGCLCPRTG